MLVMEEEKEGFLLEKTVPSAELEEESLLTFRSFKLDCLPLTLLIIYSLPVDIVLSRESSWSPRMLCSGSVSVSE